MFAKTFSKAALDARRFLEWTRTASVRVAVKLVQPLKNSPKSSTKPLYRMIFSQSKDEVLPALVLRKCLGFCALLCSSLQAERWTRTGYVLQDFQKATVCSERFNAGQFLQRVLGPNWKSLWNLSTLTVSKTLLFFDILSLVNDLITKRKLSCHDRMLYAPPLGLLLKPF